MPRSAEHETGHRDQEPVPTLCEPDLTHPATYLRFAVVEYPEHADKATICPKNSPPEELPVTWLTADKEAFVDLLAVR